MPDSPFCTTIAGLGTPSFSVPLCGEDVGWADGISQEPLGSSSPSSLP